MHIGILSGLLAAAAWALAATLYVRVPISAAAMATWKNCFAAIVLLLILLVVSASRSQPAFQASMDAWKLLFISGVLGLSLADIGYFRSIQLLGAQQGITLTLVTPILTAILSAWLLQTPLTIVKAVGILLTLIGVAIVLSQKTDSQKNVPDNQDRPATSAPGKSKLAAGIWCGIISVVFTSLGSIYLKRGTENAPHIEATFIRLFAASLSGIVISQLAGHRNEFRSLHQDRAATYRITFAALLGTVAGVWLMLICFQKCDAGTAATVTSTSPLFAIPISKFVYGRSIQPRMIVGALIAFGGVTILAGQAT